MPRDIPTTTFTERVIPTTIWETDRGIKFLLQESLGKLLLESGEGALILESSINNFWETPRKTALLEFEDGINIEFEDLILMEAEGGREDNIIDTIWI